MANPGPSANEDTHAPAAIREPVLRQAAEIYFSPGETELRCPACTLVRGASGWRHDRSCPMRGVHLST